MELLRDGMLEHPHSPGFLIDGFPRELGQAKQFENEVNGPYILNNSESEWLYTGACKLPFSSLFRSVFVLSIFLTLYVHTENQSTVTKKTTACSFYHNAFRASITNY